MVDKYIYNYTIHLYMYIYIYMSYLSLSLTRTYLLASRKAHHLSAVALRLPRGCRPSLPMHDTSPYQHHTTQHNT